MGGKGQAEGVEIHADHIQPKDLGGQAIIENGQTLCDEHTFKKKSHNQTDSGKEMFIGLYALAKAQSNLETQDFCPKSRSTITGVSSAVILQELRSVQPKL